MPLIIEALGVGSIAPPQATLDVTGTLRCSQDAQLAQWAIGALGTSNAGLLYGGLPANAAALTQTPGGQTTLNSAAGQTVQFADSGVVGLRYSRGSFLGNLVLAGGLDAGTYTQTLQLQSGGLAAANGGGRLRLAAYANGQVGMDTAAADLTLSANGAPGIVLSANGTAAFSARAVTAANLALGAGSISAGVVRLGNAALSPLANGGLLVQAPGCLAVNQPAPSAAAALDCLGNVHVAGGGVRIDGTGTSTPDLSLGFPGTFLIDSSGVPGGRLSIDNLGRANVGGSLNVSGPVSVAGQLSLAAGQALSLTGDPNHTVQYDATTDGVRLQGFAGGVLGTSQVAANALAWNNSNCSTYLPFNVYAPLTVAGGNVAVVAPDPYCSLGRVAGAPDCVLAVASAVNLHSNAAAVGDVVLKNRSGGNVVIQSSNTGPALFVTQQNAVGVQTPLVNPLTVLDVAGASHHGVDNVGSRLLNLVGRTYYAAVPTYRQLAVFYPTGNAGNGCQLSVRGPCGTWAGAKGTLLCTVSTAGGLNTSATWTGGVAAGVDLQVWTAGGVATVWLVVSAAYASYNLEVVYGGQGFTALAGAETTAAPGGTLAFSAVASPALVAGNAGITAAGGVAFTGSGANGFSDQITSETVVYRPSYNRNTQTLPVGANRPAGRTLQVCLSGGGAIQTTDSTQIYVPANDNGSTQTGNSGSTFALANNRVYTVTFDSSRWVVL